MSTLKEALQGVKDASIKMAAMSRESKDRALSAIASELETCREAIFKANRRDLDRSRAESLEAPLLKRLEFQQAKLTEALTGIQALIELDDPIGRVLEARELQPGLELFRISCPIGVIAMIFESRPDAAVQIASLALKSGNGIVLKGGRESLETLRVMVDCMHRAGVRAGMPQGWVALLESREEVGELLGMEGLVDLIIPRGSNSFVQYIMNNSSIPVLGHADGICHLYIHKDADLDMALDLSIDAKTQYVAVCNAMETLLIHADVAAEFLPRLRKVMEEKSVELRLCSRGLEIIGDLPAASEEDWKSEYLDYILSVRIVDSLEEAAEHINRYGSRHTDGIVCRSREQALKFMNSVDTASALWNCSTRFADGFRYGLGAEVGISTHKIHARGPVGMEGLTIYQWRLFGSGQTVDDVARGKTGFTHKAIDPSRYGQ